MEGCEEQEWASSLTRVSLRLGGTHAGLQRARLFLHTAEQQLFRPKSNPTLS